MPHSGSNKRFAMIRNAIRATLVVLIGGAAIYAATSVSARTIVDPRGTAASSDTIATEIVLVGLLHSR